MTPRRWALVIALFLIVLSWFGVFRARAGLIVQPLEKEGVPMVYVAPQKVGENVPGVLVAHGFAGSKQLMLGYAHVLAHGGYAVMLWDFDGHGGNSRRLENFALQRDLDVATKTLLQQPEVDPARLALLGHSMGSGAVMATSIRDPSRFAATVAISPTGAAVTPQTPRNLQLQAGSWEGGFVANAQRLLKAAGGPNQNLTTGQGRSLVLIPKAEHITILFRHASHRSALQWLDATFKRSQTSRYVDRRMLWYGLHLAAWLLLLGAITPTLPRLPKSGPMLGPDKSWAIKRWGSLLLAPLVAGGGLMGMSQGIEIQSLGGLLVGGGLGIWFLIAGLTWLGALWPLPRPTLQAVGLGLALFGLLWVAFGAIAQVTWLQWWLVPARLKLWPLLSLACFPWFIASGIVQQEVGLGSRIAWWFGQSIVLVGGLLFLVYLLPQLSFVFLLLPLFPLLMAMFAFVAAQLDSFWTYAIGSTLFFGWMLAAAFPLAGAISF